MAVLTKGLILVMLSLYTSVQGYVVNVDFHDGRTKKLDIPGGNLTAEDFLKNPRRVMLNYDSTLPKRDGPAGCPPNEVLDYYVIDGDGQPHQNYKIGQVENTLVSCPGSVSSGESHTSGWSFSGGLNPGYKQYDFASLGFSVTETDTKTTSDTFNCPSGATEICALHYTAVTAVSVLFVHEERICHELPIKNTAPGVVYLPNANGIGSSMSRGVNYGDRNIIQCRGTSERDIDFNCGPKGGPEFFETHTYGPWSKAYMSALDPSDCTVPIEALKFV